MSYTWDPASRPTQIAQGSQVVSFQYDTGGRRTRLTLPNQVVTEYQYDPASRLTALIYRNATSQLGDLTYTYDPAGNRTGIGGAFARALLPDPIASATYDAANRQLAFGGQALTYDANGNLTSDAATTYTWDARNRLLALTGPTTAGFQYDALGRRAQKTINGTPTRFLYDRLNPILEAPDGGTVATMLTGLSLDEYLTRTDAAGARALIVDGLGSTVALTDPTGAVVTSYSTEPFGRTEVSGIASANPFQYTGRENDGTGLYYYRARYYHPSLGRFIREDPLGFDSGDANLYAYVFNSPTRYRDPSGLCAVENPAACFGFPPPQLGGRKDATGGDTGAIDGTDCPSCALLAVAKRGGRASEIIKLVIDILGAIQDIINPQPRPAPPEPPTQEEREKDPSKEKDR